MDYQVFILSRMREAAIVALLGRWNWWLPRRAARALRVAPKPAPASA